MIILKAKSSSGQPYNDVFAFENGVVSSDCTCKAGIMHTLCKHRIALLQGDASMLYDPTQSKELTDIRHWVEQTDLPRLLAELKESEDVFMKAQSRVKKLRKTIEVAISGVIKKTD